VIWALPWRNPVGHRSLVHPSFESTPEAQAVRARVPLAYTRRHFRYVDSVKGVRPNSVRESVLRRELELWGNGVDKRSRGDFAAVALERPRISARLLDTETPIHPIVGGVYPAIWIPDTFARRVVNRSRFVALGCSAGRVIDLGYTLSTDPRSGRSPERTPFGRPWSGTLGGVRPEMRVYVRASTPVGSVGHPTGAMPSRTRSRARIDDRRRAQGVVSYDG